MDVLRRKLEKLMRGDEGVALVVTLALFMFLYVTSASVFAVGRSIKDKIALQNAVDAAAYSAAIVEADTLSKIATINRAMARKYVELVQLRMDYVVREWLKDVRVQYRASGSIQSAEADSAHIGYISLNTGSYATIVSIDDIDACIEGASDLESEIATAADELAPMNLALNKLRSGLTSGADSFKTVVEKILKANLADILGDWCHYRVSFADPNDWLVPQTDEGQFINQGDLGETYSTMKNGEKEDGTGRLNDLWYGLADSDGINRAYQLTDGEVLYAQWYWKAKPLDSWHFASFDAKNAIRSYSPPRETASASPLKLAGPYFSGTGAITVGVAMLQRNPWEGLLVRNNGSGSFYDVFNPYRATNWVCAVASAQAGYRPFKKYDNGNENADEDHEEDRNYRLVDDSNENLRTDDWDAVFVPVSKALSGKEFENFILSESDWQPVGNRDEVDLPDYIANEDDVARKIALPRMHNNRESDEYRKLDWNGLLQKVYH